MARLEPGNLKGTTQVRILISAFACQPDLGSEAEAGLQTILAAATEHDVWVITRQYHKPSLDEFLADHPRGERIRTIGFDLDGMSRRLETKMGLAGIHWHHDRWQRHLADYAVELDASVHFDVVHHATYAAYWTRAGVAAVGKPLVWGPIGGAVTSPLRLLPTMGWRGIIGDALRSAIRPLVARMVGTRSVIREAAVVIVQNPETARKIGRSQDAIMLPNALAAPASIPPLPVEAGRGRSNRLITAGRLLGWKGTVLAIAAMEHVLDPDAVLEVYGEGPQLSRLQRFADEQGLADRVAFKGLIARDELLARIAGAAALVHPSLHEEAGFVVSEALALGTPVVCLDRGGPPVLARAWPDVPSRVVAPTTAKRTAREIGQAINEVAGHAGDASTGPQPSFTEGLLAAYEVAARKAP